MIYRLLADAVLLLHLAFIVFVVLSGFAVLRHPRLVWLHLPTAMWGMLTEYEKICTKCVGIWGSKMSNVAPA